MALGIGLESGIIGAKSKDFIPIVITKSDTIDTLAPIAGTYYDYTNELTSLTLTVTDNILPAVIWFKSGNTATNVVISGPGVLIPANGLEINPNKSYELSIIKSRISLLEMEEL